MILIVFICLLSGTWRWWFSQNGSLWFGVNNEKLSFYLNKNNTVLTNKFFMASYKLKSPCTD